MSKYGRLKSKYDFNSKKFKDKMGAALIISIAVGIIFFTPIFYFLSGMLEYIALLITLIIYNIALKEHFIHSFKEFIEEVEYEEKTNY